MVLVTIGNQFSPLSREYSNLTFSLKPGEFHCIASIVFWNQYSPPLGFRISTEGSIMTTKSSALIPVPAAASTWICPVVAPNIHRTLHQVEASLAVALLATARRFSLAQDSSAGESHWAGSGEAIDVLGRRPIQISEICTRTRPIDSPSKSWDVYWV